MKIGEFAKINQTTIDTIRHYMDLHLIIPEKKGAHFQFDVNCQSDYESICHLKAIGFTLSEIQSIMLFHRFAKHTHYDSRMTYRSFYQNKLSEIENQLVHLTTMKTHLVEEIETMSDIDNDDYKVTGVPIEALTFLRCPHCQSDYQIEEGAIKLGAIINGKLTCSCDHFLTIADGILIGEDVLDIPLVEQTFSEADSRKYYEVSFVDDYIQNTHITYLQNLYESITWSKHHYDFSKTDNKAILEIGTGHGFLLRSILSELPENAIYFAVDHDYKKHLWLKNILDRHSKPLKIVYICCDFLKMPLNNQIIDLLIDASGSTNYAFEHTDFLLPSITPYLKDQCPIIASYKYFKKFSVNSIIDMPNRPLFQLKPLTEVLNLSGFTAIDTFKSDPISDGGPYENYFVEGEQVYTLLYHGYYTHTKDNL